ncbi:conserved Plasmodium protein, unknown function [Plasmodium ovale]|uniref:Uncharacterized protein n=1 Tax=Plasmodium ovale TaxID=36330 RepID=A0A1C3KNI1_PLAOA|nr:conserved Plasmodium protein, unknown function [Plasmodium ovale]
MNTTDDDRLGLCGGFIAKGVDLLETGIDWRRNNPDDRHDDDDNVPGGDAPPRACEKKRKDLYNGVGVTLFDYIYEMVNGRSELRKLQMKLTLYSANRCIDFFNDMMFLLNIFYKIYFGLDSREKTVHVYNIIFLWLLMIFITSMSTFYFRKLLILNFVPHRHSNLFTLWKVFKEVKITDQRDISALYFYERFQKTYFIINNFLEDIPQFFLYSLYTILDEQDVYLVFAMVSSVGFIVVRTFYQGIHCPAIGTRHLFFSTHLVEDSFVQCDVAPTTNAFFLYSAVVLFIWSLLSLSTRKLVIPLLAPVVYIHFSALLLASLVSLFLFLRFYSRTRKRFYLNPYYSLRDAKEEDVDCNLFGEA